jgi:sugar lactone lactonase YvrE
VLDGNSLKFLQAFTHPAFSEVPNDLFTYGPNGTAFNERGNLVVAAYTKFVEFSDYGVEYKTYPKVASEANENIIFDSLGNLYTTTATGGTDKLNQYSAADYSFKQTISLPPGAGQLTGITFDGYGRLYVASQSDNTIHVSDFNFEFLEFKWVKTLPGAGNVKGFEGLQFNATGELVAAAGDLVRYDVMAASKLGTFDAPNDEFPVPLRVDNEGNIYTADYENGSGSVPADVLKFSPEGLLLVTQNDAGLLGPFGLAISGTVLAGDPPVEWSYALAATDPDGDPLTYKLVKGPPDMYLDPNTSTLTWYVTSEDIGDYDIVLEVSDGQGGVTQQMFILSVSAG